MMTSQEHRPGVWASVPCWRRCFVLSLLLITACATKDPGPKTLVAKTDGMTCKSGNALICYKQATRYAQGDGVTADDKKALYYYERACALDHAQGCWLGARKYEATAAPGSTKRARALYKKLCDHHIQKGCHRLGWSLFDHSPIDAKRGVEVFARACKTHAPSCIVLGAFYYQGRRLKQDRARARGYYQRGCALKSGRSCYLLARLFKRQSEDTFRLYQRACGLQFQEACVQQYTMMLTGTGTTKDVAGGLNAMLDHCNAIHPSVCVRIARAMLKGSPGRPEWATTLLSKTCDAQHAQSCGVLGLWYDFGKEGVPIDVKKAMTFYARACQRDAGYACVNLGLMYEHGRGVKADYARAFRLQRKACNTLGVPYGCLNLGRMYRRGKGTKADIKKGTALLKKQCQANVLLACEDLAYAQAMGTYGPGDFARGKAKLKQLCDKGRCVSYGRLLKQAGDVKGAIAVTRGYCTKETYNLNVDACIRLVSWGQTQYRDAAKAGAQVLCKRAFKAYCNKTFDAQPPKP